MKFNNKGFTLILVLLVIAVLSILGTTLLGLTVSNYKMKVVNTKAKQSFYLSEAGLEESYAKVYIWINDSIEYANSEVEKFSEAEMKKKDSPHIDKNGQIDKDILQAKFKEAYEQDIRNKIINNLPFNGNEDRMYDKVEIKEISDFNKGEMEVTIDSTSSVDKVKRTSQVTLVITTPDYNGTTQVSDHHILTKVISADNKIDFETGTNNIYGDIMAKDVFGNTQNIHGYIYTSNGNLGVNKQLASNNSEIKIINNNEIIYIAKTNNSGENKGNDKSEKDICLLGKNASETDLPKNVNNVEIIYMNDYETYKGIIISKHDIYILGDITFYGTIISRKDVNISTNDKRNLHYDANYIENTINENVLSEYFKIYNSDIFEQNINNQNPEDFIELKDWQIP